MLRRPARYRQPSVFRFTNDARACEVVGAAEVVAGVEEVVAEAAVRNANRDGVGDDGRSHRLSCVRRAQQWLPQRLQLPQMRR